MQIVVDGGGGGGIISENVIKQATFTHVFNSGPSWFSNILVQET